MKKTKQRIQQLCCDRNQKEVTDRAFWRLMLPSVLSILLCIVSLGGLTWAWFSDSTTSCTETIHAASYGIQADVNMKDSAKYININADSTYTLVAGKKYAVTLTATGNASTGYCKISLNGKEYYTTQIVPGDSLEFDIDCSDLTDDIAVLFTPNWMTYSGYSEDAQDLIGQTIMEIKAEDTSYTSFFE